MAKNSVTIPNTHANRGRALETLVEQANAIYRSQGTAVIHKVPTAWVPLRRGPKIVTAKVEKKAAVDFLGHVTVPGYYWALPIAFDAKEVSKGDRWPLSRLEPHQYEYLKDCSRTGAFTFVLIGYWQLRRFFVLPFSELEKRLAGRQAGGSASVKAGEKGLIEVEFMDYLRFLQSERSFNHVPDFQHRESSG